MPSDPIARWESEGGSILPIERLRLASRSDAPRHMADDLDASERNLAEHRDVLVVCAVAALAAVPSCCGSAARAGEARYDLRMRREARDIDECSRTAPPGSRLHLVVFQRIVCGVDGSPEGFEALRQAALLRASEGRLVAVTVFDASPAAGTGLGAARLAVKRREDEGGI